MAGDGREVLGMRHLLLLLILLVFTLPSTAQAIIDDLHISRDGDIVNIRVSVRNTGNATQAGPMLIEVFARQTSSDDWQPVISWSNIPKLASGHRVSRDYFSQDEDQVTAMAARGLFEVRAILSGQGLSEVTEKVADYDPDHHH